MTPEQIAELARQSGMAFHMGQPHPEVLRQLERFAKFIESATRAECAMVCRNLIANQGTSANISIAKDIANLCAEAIER